MTPFLRCFSLLLLPGAVFVLVHVVNFKQAILERTNSIVLRRRASVNEQAFAAMNRTSVWNETAPVLDETEDPQRTKDDVRQRRSSVNEQAVGIMNQTSMRSETAPVLNTTETPKRTKDIVQQHRSSTNNQDVGITRTSVWNETTPVLDTTEIPQWIQDYIDFHKESMANVMNGTTDVNHYLIYTCKNTTRYCSGTGDRQRGIFAMFIVAVLTKRILLIDMDNPVPLSQILEPHLINWKDIPNYMDDLPSEFEDIRNIKPSPLERPQDFAIVVRPQVVRLLANQPASLNKIWYTTEMQTHLATYAEPEPQELPPPDIYKIIFYSLFRPTTALTKTVQAQRHTLGLHLSESRSCRWRLGW